MTNEQTLEKKLQPIRRYLQGLNLFIYCNLITEMQMYSYTKEREKCHEESLQKSTRPRVKVDHQIHIIQLRFTLSNKKNKTKTN